MSRVMWHVSRVTYSVLHIFYLYIYFFFYKVVGLVGVGSVINRAYPVLFLNQSCNFKSVLDLYILMGENTVQVLAALL